MNDTPAPAPRRSARSSKVVGALVGAVAALSIGGVGLAFAQEAETPTADEDCPDKNGHGGDGDAGGADGGDAGATDAADDV